MSSAANSEVVPWALVIVSPLFRQTGPQRQDRLRSIQRLHLRFFIDTEHNGTFGGIQIQAHYVAHLLDQVRIGGKFEGLAALRLEAKAAPDAHHSALAQPDFGGERTRAPVGSRARETFQRPRHCPFHGFVRDPARGTGARLVGQAFHSSGPKALTPLAHRSSRNAQPARNVLISKSFRMHEERSSPAVRRAGLSSDGVPAVRVLFYRPAPE